MANELKGFKELERKLLKLSRTLDVKTGKQLRSVLFKSTTPVLRQMKARIPVGTETHRTYKKRLVAPGFAKRSFRRLTGKKYLNQGKLSIAMGVRAEAYYAIRFYDLGPYTITRRRQSTNIKARGHVGNQRRKISIKPYTLRRHPFFVGTFIANESAMIQSMGKQLKDIIYKLAKQGG